MRLTLALRRMPNNLSTELEAVIMTAVTIAVRPAVAEALTDALPEILRRSKIPTYLTRQQVMDLTGWSDRHLSYLQKERRLPFVKRGRTVRFLASDVEKHLMEGYVVTTDASASETGDSEVQ